MAVRAIKALNTTAGLGSYIVVAIGAQQEITTIARAFQECGMRQQDVAFVHKEKTKQGN